MPIRVTVIGLGAIGRTLLAELLTRPEVEVVAAADAAPALAGQDVGTVAGRAPCGITVAASAAEAYRRAASDVAILCTSSYVPDIAPQIDEALAAGRHVLTTCEELAEPLAHPEAAPLDDRARAAGRVVLATGVNPGLVMDRLPLLLCQACVRVERVRVVRWVDVSRRRVELQRKVGVGMEVAAFRDKVATGRFGHVGLPESALLVARGLGLRGPTIDEVLEPVLARDDGRGVPAGRVLGIHQRVEVREPGSARTVTLDLEMSARHPAPRDEVHVDGDPPVHLVIDGGVMGDRATLGTVLNALALVRQAPPGLRSVIDLPLFGLLR